MILTMMWFLTSILYSRVSCIIFFFSHSNLCLNYIFKSISQNTVRIKYKVFFDILCYPNRHRRSPILGATDTSIGCSFYTFSKTIIFDTGGSSVDMFILGKKLWLDTVGIDKPTILSLINQRCLCTRTQCHRMSNRLFTK